MNWLWIVAIVAGVSNPLQSGANSELVKHTNGAVVAAFIVYAIGSMCLLLALPIIGAAPTGQKLSSMPWWGWVGGVCNVTFLLSTLLVTKRLGSAVFTTLVVITAVLTSLALDHFGLLGFEARPASIGRLAGAALAVAGVICIARY